MTLGGKARRSPAARLFFEPSQALNVETPTPLAHDLARCVSSLAAIASLAIPLLANNTIASQEVCALPR